MPAKPGPIGSRTYRAAIGRPRESLTTPCLVLDVEVVRRNIAAMAGRIRTPTRLRPHAKCHKCAEIARLQLAAGAAGVTVATVWEAAALAETGITDILIANEVVGWEKMRVAAEVAKRAKLSVALDAIRNAEELSAAAAGIGVRLGALIDVDTGNHRTGVRAPNEAMKLAERIGRLPGLKLLGVMGYEGHAAREKDRSTRMTLAAEAMDRLLEVVDQMEAVGYPVEVVSAGTTATWDTTGSNPRVTELQSGSYVLMDAAKAEFVPDFACALTVLATVVSRQGDTLVVDAGRKTVGAEFALPRATGPDAGKLTPRHISEEHLLFDAAPGYPLGVGDRLEIIPGNCPTTVNLHDVYYVVQGNTVIDVWPILARGPGVPLTKE
jgi:D-serine deaminase-like pyridoxal phosphate-dependent protein